MERALRTEAGMTLVEVLIALVVFLLVSLALVQTALLSIDANMISTLRDEGVRIAEQRMNDTRGLSFKLNNDTLSGASDFLSLPSSDCSSAFRAYFPTGVVVSKSIRSQAGFKFCTNRTVTLLPNALNPNSARVTITVGWQWRSQDYSHSISTIIARQS